MLRADLALRELAAYRFNLLLDTRVILGLSEHEHPLNWNSIGFGANEIDKVPDDKRGIYAFVISDQRTFLPPHGYVMYIGIAGRNSNRSLRARYEDYLITSQVVRRPLINALITRWCPILRFHFAPVSADISSPQLKSIERRLITAFLPPCCQNDVEGIIRRRVAAF